MSLLVTMGDSDVTKYVKSCYVKQGTNILFRQFTILFEAWNNIQPDEVWNIWASYDPTDPKAELLIRNGVIPPDQQPEFTIAAGESPRIRVTGYDYVWLAQRRFPRQTLVLADTMGAANRAVADYDDIIGAYRVVTRRSSLRKALRYLGNQAGIRVDCRLPRRALSPIIINPTMSYWRAMLELARPWAPYIYYEATRNTVVFEDPLTAQVTTGSNLELHADTIKSMSGVHSITKNINRVIIEVKS